MAKHFHVSFDLLFNYSLSEEDIRAAVARGLKSKEFRYKGTYTNLTVDKTAASVSTSFILERPDGTEMCVPVLGSKADGDG